MGKRSHAHTRAFFTQGEREGLRNRYGSVRERLGEDSQARLDSCGLCLSRLRDPVASPAGQLYCKACIFSNLLAQKEALAVQRKQYEAEAARRKEAADLAAAGSQAAAVAAFVESESRLAGAASSIAGAGHAESEARRRELAAIATLSSKVDTRDEAARKTSAFWVPERTPSAAASEGAAPDPCPRDPITGEFLRAKQLIPVVFTRNKELVEKGSEEEAGGEEGEKGEGAGGGEGAPAAAAAAASASPPTSSSSSSDADGASSTTSRFICPTCLKGLVYQQTFLMKACGHVLCAECTGRFVAPAKACAVCSAAVATKADLLPLKRGGSAYAANAGTQATATVYRPVLPV